MGVSRGTLWTGVAVAAALLAGLLGVAGLGIDMSRAVRPMLPVSLAIAAALARPRLRGVRETRLADLAECWGLMALVCTMGAIASYAVIRLTTGQVDAWLAAIDRVLGFDWIAAYRFTVARPLIARVSELAYLSIFFSPLVVIAGLALTGRAERARALIAAFGIALAIGLVIFCFCPARSALDYYMGHDISYIPATGISHLAVIDQLRAGTMTVIDVTTLSGMITFPSFHAVSAVLFIWAAWPLRWLRWPCLAVNLAMLIVTPVQGTHYLIDVIGGVALALAVISALHMPALRRPLRMPIPVRRPALG